MHSTLLECDFTIEQIMLVEKFTNISSKPLLYSQNYLELEFPIIDHKSDLIPKFNNDA